jgi:hypothetical protein
MVSRVKFDDREPESVLNWCRELCRVTADGAVWGIPRSQIVFRFDKRNKRLVLIVGTEDNPDFIATRRVFGQIGWSVITAEEERRLKYEQGTNN